MPGSNYDFLKSRGRRGEWFFVRNKDRGLKGEKLVNLTLSRKKSNYVIRFFELHWRSRFSQFSLRTFGEIAGIPGPNETSDETHNQKMFRSSGSD